MFSVSFAAVFPVSQGCLLGSPTEPCWAARDCVKLRHWRESPGSDTQIFSLPFFLLLSTFAFNLFRFVCRNQIGVKNRPYVFCLPSASLVLMSFHSFSVTGFDLWGAVVATGVVCTFYCTLVCWLFSWGKCLLLSPFTSNVEFIEKSPSNWVAPFHSTAAATETSPSDFSGGKGSHSVTQTFSVFIYSKCCCCWNNSKKIDFLPKNPPMTFLLVL